MHMHTGYLSAGIRLLVQAVYIPSDKYSNGKNPWHKREISGSLDCFGGDSHHACRSGVSLGCCGNPKGGSPVLHDAFVGLSDP